jgi:phenylpropionate dioxygenase-like ring-hydroxylating dioxygenase large terminal subunit
MPDGFLLLSIRPVDVELTESTFSWWFPEETTLDRKLLQAAVVNFGHLVNTEDVEICTHAQKGMRSSVYHQGRYSAEQGKCLHHLHRLTTAYMEPHLAPPVNGRWGTVNGRAAAEEVL